MTKPRPAIPDDPALMREMINGLLDEVDAQRAKIEQQRVLIQTVLRRLYGPRAERYDPNQMSLLGEAEKVDAPAAPTKEDEEGPDEAPRRRSKRRSRRDQRRELPHKRIVYEVPPDERVCAACGTEKVKIGEDISEEIDYVPASITINEHVRAKMVCRNCECVTMAPRPPRAIEKGVPSPGMLSQVVVSKYDDHLPLNRQERIFERQGLRVARSTLCDWVHVSGDILEPIYDEMKNEILASHIVWTDDTPVPVLDATRDSTRTGRLWVYIGDAAHPFTVFDYTPNRRRDGPVEFLGEYAGFLQADAYGGYDGIYAGRRVIEVGCWGHGRRKFFDAKDSDPARGEIAMAHIREFYAVEREARERELDFEARKALRQERSVGILEKLKAWLDEEQSRVLPKSPMGTAFGYALGNWDALVRYCEDGELEPDNNRAERAIRRIAIGRKNWMFAGSDRGGRTCAILMSICASCHQHGVDPWAYIRDVLIRVSVQPNSLKRELLPDRWKLEHDQARAAADHQAAP